MRADEKLRKLEIWVKASSMSCDSDGKGVAWATLGFEAPVFCFLFLSFFKKIFVLLQKPLAIH
jgi:hypothetical protein